MRLTIKEYEEKQKLVEKLLNELKEATIIPDNPFDVKHDDYVYRNGVGYSATKLQVWAESDISAIKSWACAESDVWAESNIDEFIPCKDKSIVEARQKRHRLADLLEKFAYDNDIVVTADMWEDKTIPKYYIYYDYANNDYGVYDMYTMKDLSTIYFTSMEATEKAIKEVVIPFNEGMRNI